MAATNNSTNNLNTLHNKVVNTMIEDSTVDTVEVVGTRTVDISNTVKVRVGIIKVDRDRMDMAGDSSVCSRGISRT